MMKPKFIYIDDFVDQSIQAIRDGLRDTGIIDVDLAEVKEFKEQISGFEGELRQYDGAILDLRLDGNHALNVKYTAASLAQELRSRSAASEGIKDIPLVLCSTDQKIKALYDRDQTSHDLFDYAFKKDKRPDWREIAHTLQSLASGYDLLRQRITGNLDIFGRNTSEIDSRLLSIFPDRELQLPPHEIAQHLIKDLFLQPGPLINQFLVAARLGVDIEHSPDWENLLLNFFVEAKYNGVFCDGWSRWWADIINSKFKSFSGKRLAALNAEDRVEAIKNETGLSKLEHAEPIKHNISTNFWTICEYFKKPLDPMEGFKVYTRKQQKPWQETRYLSFEAAAERRGYDDGLRVHPDENERLETAKQRIRKQA